MPAQNDTADFWFEDPGAAIDMACLQASTSWEIDFMEQQRARFERYGAKMFLSGKQADIIRKIGKLDQ